MLFSLDPQSHNLKASNPITLQCQCLGLQTAIHIRAWEDYGKIDARLSADQPTQRQRQARCCSRSQERDKPAIFMTMRERAKRLFRHACKLGFEAIVSKRLGSPYISGRSRHWIKSKNPAAPAVKREAEEDWR